LQHGWLAAPHGAHWPVASHTDVASQVVPQQIFPATPQAVHMPPVHKNPVEQVEPPQQLWLAPPQRTQVPPLPQTLLPAQAEPAQHAWPTPPHDPHVPALEQVTPAAVQVLPVQHNWPVPPHAAHVPCEHTLLPEQTSPAQQGLPVLPQAISIDASPTPPVSTPASGRRSVGTSDAPRSPARSCGRSTTSASGRVTIDPSTASIARSLGRQETVRKIRPRKTPQRPRVITGATLALDVRKVYAKERGLITFLAAPARGLCPLQTDLPEGAYRNPARCA
jgi:hypothetical protein